jgi:hypothetical protein
MKSMMTLTDPPLIDLMVKTAWELPTGPNVSPALARTSQAPSEQAEISSPSLGYPAGSAQPARQQPATTQSVQAQTA